MDAEGLFGRSPLMAILRGFGPERTVELANKAWDLGLVCVEVPVQNDTDVESLTRTVAAGRDRGMPVGAGTILSPDQATLVAGLGAAFTVSPGFDPDVVKASRSAGLPALPGVSSASDIQQALRLGLSWLKAFPASVLTPDWFKAMAGPFPDVRFVATGGLDAYNAQGFWDAGVQMVAVGSALADEEQLPALAQLLGARSTGL